MLSRILGAKTHPPLRVARTLTRHLDMSLFYGAGGNDTRMTRKRRAGAAEESMVADSCWEHTPGVRGGGRC